MKYCRRAALTIRSAMLYLVFEREAALETVRVPYRSPRSIRRSRVAVGSAEKDAG